MGAFDPSTATLADSPSTSFDPSSAQPADDAPVGWAEENLAGPSEILAGTAANVVGNLPHGAASGAVDLYRRLTGGDTDAPDPSWVQSMHVGNMIGKGGQKAISDIASILPGTPNGLDASDQEIRDSLDPTGKVPIEQLRAQYKEESGKPLSKLLQGHGSTAGDLIGGALDVGSDVGNIVAPFAAAKSLYGGVKDIAGELTAPKRAPAPYKPPARDVEPEVSAESLATQPDPLAPKAPAAPATPAQDALEDFQKKINGGAIKVGTPLADHFKGLIRNAEREKQAQGTAEGTLPGERGTPRAAPPPSKAPPPFKKPADEGPQETPTPDKQAEREQHLKSLDDLSGGLLPNRRLSAVTGDYGATGDDYQAKEVGSTAMKKQIASENDALHAATEGVHQSVGSQFDNSVDPTTLDNRGRTVRNAVQAIEAHFDNATNSLYDAAREQNRGRQLPQLARLRAYLADDSNFANDAEIGLQKAANARLDRLWSTGDPDKGAPPGSVNAAESMRQFLNEKGKNPSAWGVAKDMKGHLDADVAEHGGPGLFEQSRAQRVRQAQLLEEPTGIKKLLAPSDSQGINHAIPAHKVMDYIADLPTEQHEHVINALRSSAHLSPELAESSAAAIREIQAHAVSRLHDAATNADGSWNARTFYNAAAKVGRNAPATFADRPDIVKSLQTINDAGNTLHMDKHYPGAGAQIERTGAAGRLVMHGVDIAASAAHHIPIVGRIVGRGLEEKAAKIGGEMNTAAREKEVQGRIIDRDGNTLNGKPPKAATPPAPAQPLGARAPGNQRGAVGDLTPSKADFANAEHVTMETPVSHTTDEHGDHVFSTGEGKSHLKAEDTEDGGLRVRGSFTHPEDQRQGHGGVLYKHAADEALKNGGTFTSDEKVSEPAARRWAELQRQGYALQKSPRAKVTSDKGLITDDGSPVFSVAGKRSLGSQIPGQRGSFSSQNDNPINKPTGARNKQRGGSIGATPKPAAEGNGSTLNVGLHQGNEGEPGFRKMSKQEPQAAVESTGAKVTKNTVLTPQQHGVAEPTSVMSTDRPLSHEDMQGVLAKTKQSAIPQRTDAGEESMHVAPGHEATAKAQGWDKFSPEQFREHDGSVRAASEKPLAGAPEGDKPNATARGAAAAYAKSAGVDYKPLDEYKYVDPKVAKSVGDAYEDMKHDPTDPKVAKSYDAFKAETLAQYKQMVKSGMKVDLDPNYPYKNPRDMHEDVRANNHMSIYPTEEGFGTSGAAPSDHPMLEKAPIKMGGKDATYNDLFRAVHDYYGHAAEGNGFRANGEYNAWRAHRQLYSDAARGAMDSETLGQNSWVNSGPPAAMNKGASSADTIYADQKAGLLPRAVTKAAEEGVGADEHHITNQLTDQERNQLRSDTTKRLVDAFHSAPAAEEYAAAGLAGAAKRGWYRNSSQAIVNQFGHEAPRFAALLSAMSPQVSVQTNFANALKTYINWDKAGRPDDPGIIRQIMEDSSQKSAKNTDRSNVMDSWVNNSVRALTADDPTNVKLSGPKVHSFYNNLTDNVNEVTNDAWMASFAKIDPEKLGGGLTKTGPGKSPTYLALSGKVRQAASILSRLTGEVWTPAEVQETVWSWAKTAYEHAEEKGSDVSIPDLVKNGDITDELIRSTPDFHQLFGTSEHRGLLQSSRFASNAEGVAPGQSTAALGSGSSKARQAAAETLKPHLMSAAERLESVRQERRAAGKTSPKKNEEDE